jgi:hypothetical protein
MNMLRLIGTIDEQHRLTAEVPATVPAGQVEVVLVLPSDQEDEVSEAWMAGIAREWEAELSDPREDIYTINDGEPVDGAR